MFVWISLFPSAGALGVGGLAAFRLPRGSPQPPGRHVPPPAPLPRRPQPLSQAPALSHARWNVPKRTPPPPQIPVPLPPNRSLPREAERPNEIPAASSCLELPPPSRPRERARARGEHVLAGPGMLSTIGCWVSSLGGSLPAAPGAPRGPAPAPRALAPLQSHSFAKRNWQRTRDQLETASIGGRSGERGISAPCHPCSSPIHAAGGAKNPTPALIATGAPRRDTSSPQGAAAHSPEARGRC